MRAKPDLPGHGRGGVTALLRHHFRNYGRAGRSGWAVVVAGVGLLTVVALAVPAAAQAVVRDGSQAPTSAGPATQPSQVKIDASVNLAPAPVVVRFVALGPVAAHWTWNFDDGTVLSKQPNKVSHPYASAGDYNVTATYRDPATGAEMTGTVTVMLYPSTPARVQISGRPGIQVLPKDGNAKVTYTVTYPTRDTGPWQRDLEIYNQNHVLVTEKVWSTNTATDVTTDVEFSKIGYYWATVRVRKAAPAIGPWLSSGVALNIVDPDLMQPSPRPTSPSPSTPKTPRP